MTLRRNDRHDTDPMEAKLIRVGHHLVRLARLKGLTASERRLSWEAAEIVWDAKREYREELRLRREQRAAVTRAAFAGVSPQQVSPQQQPKQDEHCHDAHGQTEQEASETLHAFDPPEHIYHFHDHSYRQQAKSQHDCQDDNRQDHTC